MPEWMEIVDGKLKHHVVMPNGEKPLHMVAQGEGHYGPWLMTPEEIEISKKHQDDLEDISEWNKIADYGIRQREDAYEQGKKDKELNLPRNLEYGNGEYSKHPTLAKRANTYYDAGYDGIAKDKINAAPAIIHQCPWHSEETTEYYKNHPFVKLSPWVSPAPYMTWKKAIAERGTEEKMKEFVEYYNKLKGEK